MIYDFEKCSKLYSELATYDQFIMCRFRLRESGKVDKIPCNLQGNINALDHENWLSLEQVVSQVNQRNKALGEPYFGIGFVITEHDPFFCLDIDNALENGVWNSQTQELTRIFKGCLTELSHSKSGMHIWGSYYGELPEHANRNHTLNIEFYHTDRFICLGSPIAGDEGADCTRLLKDVLPLYLPLKPEYRSATVEWSSEPVLGSNPILDDEELIATACQKDANFANLFAGDPVRVYPSPSQADAALAQKLCFYTGNNAERIHTIMMMSGLVRDKWQRDDYLKERTILGCMKRQREFYGKKELSDFEKEEQLEKAATVAEEEKDLFKGCIYITDENSVLIDNGLVLSAGSFNGLYGGYRFTIGVDRKGVPVKVKNAFMAFTQNELVEYPKAHTAHFDATQPFGSIIEKDNVKSVNVYKALTDTSVEGDVTRFITHINNLLPNKHDSDILMRWMAHKAKYPGALMRWAVVLVGGQGNGKSTVCDIMANIIGRKFVSVVQPNDIGSKFNSWAHNKLLAVVNDFSVDDKKNVLEALKPIVTDAHIPIQRKGFDTQEAKNHLGIMITTNHKNGVLKHRDDRRYSVLFTAQENENDLLRDCMGQEYFNDLYKWLDNEEGYQKIHRYLLSLDVEEISQRAEKTSGEAIAIRESLSGPELIIAEAIEDEEPGFQNGVIISTCARELLESAGYQSRNPRFISSVVRTLGYASVGGRINNSTGGKYVVYFSGSFDASKADRLRRELVDRSGWVDNIDESF